MTLKENANLIKETFSQEGSRPKDIAKALGSSFVQPFKKIAKWATDKFKGMIDYVLPKEKNMDNVKIRADYKTLIGRSASDLFQKTDVESLETVDTKGNRQNVAYLNPKCDYETIMRSNNLSFHNWTDYDNLDLNHKAAYEMVLITKKYLNAQKDLTGTALSDSVDEYKNMAFQYKDVVENNGGEWDTVMRIASLECQYETAYYNEYKNKLGYSGNAKDAMLIANQSHRVLLTVAGDDFVDSDINWKIPYEQTMTNDIDGGFLPYVGDKISGAAHTVTHPGEIKFFQNMKNSVKNFAEGTFNTLDAMSAKGIGEFESEESVEQIPDVETISEDKTAPVDKYEQSKSALGISDELEQSGTEFDNF